MKISLLAISPTIRTILAALLLASLFAMKGEAQLLNGDFSAGKTNFSSDYFYDANGSYQPASYTIQTNSQRANYNYPKFGDHTTGTGQMLLADGSTTNNKTVWSQTVPVEQNTDYAFSAWAASAGSNSPAVLQFLVNSNRVGADFPLSPNSGEWQRFVAVWNSGSNTQASLRIVDSNLVFVGNDFALDDLSFSAVTNEVAGIEIYPAVEIIWGSAPDAFYQVQYSTSLNTNRWVNLGQAVQSDASTTHVFDSTRGQPHKFYRVLPLN
jgi:hypothetical protein